MSEQRKLYDALTSDKVQTRITIENFPDGQCNSKPNDEKTFQGQIDFLPLVLPASNAGLHNSKRGLIASARVGPQRLASRNLE
jgi:hypothetical protein